MNSKDGETLLAYNKMARINDSFKRTLTVIAPLRLEVKTGSGDISVKRGEDGILAIDASFQVRASTKEKAHELAEQIKADPPIEVLGDRVCIGDLRKYGLSRGIRGSSVSCTFRITAPASTAAELNTGSGEQEVEGLHGPVKTDAGSGDVRIEDVEQDVGIDTGSGEITVIRVGGGVCADAGSGNVRIEDVGRAVEVDTGSGEITVIRAGSDVSADAGSGNVRIEDVNGDVDIDIGSGEITVIRAGGDVSADAGSGNVRIEDAGRGVEVDTGSGNVTIDSAIAAAADWSVSTGSGDVRMKLPCDSGFNLSAKSNSGEFKTDLPLTIAGKLGRRVKGTVGKDPSATIQITTSSGDIKIEARK